MKTTDFITENQFIGDDAHAMYADHEVQMARGDCYNAAKYAIELHKLLKNVSEMTGLDGWVSEKITLANDYLRTVHEYLMHEMAHPQEVMPEMFTAESAEIQFAELLGEQSDVDEEFRLGKKLGTRRDRFKSLRKEDVAVEATGALGLSLDDDPDGEYLAKNNRNGRTMKYHAKSMALAKKTIEDMIKWEGDKYNDGATLADFTITRLPPKHAPFDDVNGEITDSQGQPISRGDFVYFRVPGDLRLTGGLVNSLNTPVGRIFDLWPDGNENGVFWVKLEAPLNPKESYYGTDARTYVREAKKVTLIPNANDLIDVTYNRSWHSDQKIDKKYVTLQDYVKKYWPLQHENPNIRANYTSDRTFEEDRTDFMNIGKKDVAEAGMSDQQKERHLAAVRAYHAKKKADKEQRSADSRAAFGNMLGGSPAELTSKLKIREQGVAEGKRTPPPSDYDQAKFVQLIQGYTPKSHIGREIQQRFSSTDYLLDESDELVGLIEEYFYEGLANGSEGPALPDERADIRAFRKAVKMSKTPGVSESSHDVDHMPGATRNDLSKDMQAGCKRCGGHRHIYKDETGKVSQNNFPGAKKYKCGACSKPGVADDGTGDINRLEHRGEEYNVYFNQRKGMYTARGTGQMSGQIQPEWFHTLADAIDHAEMEIGGYDEHDGIAEERTETKNEKGEVTSWRDEGEWKKSEKKDPRGRVTNLSDRARRATKKTPVKETTSSAVATTPGVGKGPETGTLFGGSYAPRTPFTAKKKASSSVIKR